MKVDVYAAVSQDGFISTKGGDSSWVKDDELFEQACRTYGVVCLGKTTFKQFEGELYPLDGVEHVVLSHKPRKSKYPNVHFVENIDQAITKAEDLGFKKLLVIGGAKTNQSFIERRFVRKLYMDKHPVKLGTGKKLWGEYKRDVVCVVKKEIPYNGFVHIECEVIKRGQ